MSVVASPVPIGDVVLWAILAFAMWLGLIALLNRLGVHASAMIAAPLSWLLARLLMAGVPELIHWAAHATTTMVG